MTRTRRWTEDDAPAPLDLRLAVPAMAVWAGCLVGLWATAAAWWVIASLAALLMAVLLVAILPVSSLRAGPSTGGARRRFAPRPGTGIARRPPSQQATALIWTAVATLACGAAAVLISTLHVHATAADPLVRAAADHAWVQADVTLNRDPQPVSARFPAPTAAGAAETHWLLDAHATSATIGGVRRDVNADVTAFADGSGWRAVTAGQQVRIGGTTTPDTFGPVTTATIRVRGGPDILAGPPWWMSWASAARTALRHTADALPADRGGLLRGLTVGDTGGIDAALSADAKITGLTHLLAVSGSHMAIVAGLALVALRRFGPRIAAGGAGIALAGMVVLVGPSPSVLRAVVMGAVALIALLTGRERAALPALAATTMALLYADPELAATPGFALSVQATAALIILAPVWIRALHRRGIPRGWAGVIVLPVAAHLATMPVVASLSGTVSLVAIPANMLVAPVVAPALLLGLGCAVLGPWWPGAATSVARLDGPLLGWIAGIAHRLADWPGAVVAWPATPAGVVGLAAVTICGLLVLRHRRARAAALAACIGIAAVLIPARAVHPGWPAPGWLLTACDVGQGDGFVLSTGVPGRVVVVDTGPTPAPMDACLDSLGVSDIALLVITHLHADHVGGVAAAFDGRHVERVGVGPDRSSPAAFADLERRAAASGAPVVSLRPGMHIGSGSLALTVLGPAQDYHGTDSDPNNDSVVMMAVDHGVRILMAGDIERPAQQALLDDGVDLRADVLKQPHHGSSKLLPEFVAAVHARVAVIGVGADNDYGHPAASALATDRQAGITTILRTDRDGAIQVCSASDRAAEGGAPALGTVTAGPTLLAR